VWLSPSEVVLLNRIAERRAGLAEQRCRRRARRSSIRSTSATTAADRPAIRGSMSAFQSRVRTMATGPVLDCFAAHRDEGAFISQRLPDAAAMSMSLPRYQWRMGGCGMHKRGMSWEDPFVAMRTPLRAGPSSSSRRQRAGRGPLALVRRGYGMGGGELARGRIRADARGSPLARR
jgi:hypothetical protein